MIVRDYLSYFVALSIATDKEIFIDEAQFGIELRSNIYISLEFNTDAELEEFIRKTKEKLKNLNILKESEKHDTAQYIDFLQSFVATKAENGKKPHIIFNLSDVIAALRIKHNVEKNRVPYEKRNEEAIRQDINKVKSDFSSFADLLTPYGLSKWSHNLFLNTNFANRLMPIFTKISRLLFNKSINESYVYQPKARTNRSGNIIHLPANQHGQQLKFKSEFDMVAHNIADDSFYELDEDQQKNAQENFPGMHYQVHYGCDENERIMLDNIKILGTKENKQVSLHTPVEQKAIMLFEALKLLLKREHTFFSKYKDDNAIEDAKIHDPWELVDILFTHKLIDLLHSTKNDEPITVQHLPQFFNLVFDFLSDLPSKRTNKDKINKIEELLTSLRNVMHEEVKILQTELHAGHVTSAKKHAEFINKLHTSLKTTIYEKNPGLKETVDFVSLDCQANWTPAECRYANAMRYFMHAVDFNDHGHQWIAAKISKNAINNIGNKGYRFTDDIQTLQKIFAHHANPAIKIALQTAVNSSLELEDSGNKTNFNSPAEQQIFTHLLQEAISANKKAEKQQKVAESEHYENKVFVQLTEKIINDNLIKLPENITYADNEKLMLWKKTENGTIIFDYMAISFAKLNGFVTEEQYNGFYKFLTEHDLQGDLDSYVSESKKDFEQALASVVYLNNNICATRDVEYKVVVQLNDNLQKTINRNLAIKGIIELSNPLDKNGNELIVRRKDAQKPYLELKITESSNGTIEKAEIETYGTGISFNKEMLFSNMQKMIQKNTETSSMAIEEIGKTAKKFLNGEISFSQLIELRGLMRLIPGEELSEQKNKAFNFARKCIDLIDNLEKLKDYPAVKEIQAFFVEINQWHAELPDAHVATLIRHNILLEQALQSIKNDKVPAQVLQVKGHLLECIAKIREYSDLKMATENFDVRYETSYLGSFKDILLGAKLKDDTSIPHHLFIKAIDPDQTKVMYINPRNKSHGRLAIVTKTTGVSELTVKELDVGQKVYLLDAEGKCRARYDKQAAAYELPSNQIFVHAALETQYNKQNLHHYRLPEALLDRMATQIKLLNQKLEKYTPHQLNTDQEALKLMDYKSKFEQILLTSVSTGIRYELAPRPNPQPVVVVGNRIAISALFKKFSQTIYTTSDDLLQDIRKDMQTNHQDNELKCTLLNGDTELQNQPDQVEVKQQDLLVEELKGTFHKHGQKA